jgi:hypothetical protein
MNITTEQIPDEVVEAAVEAFLANTGQAHTVTELQRELTAKCMRPALAAALPVLLGEPVGHVGKFAFDALNASRADEQNGFVELWMRPLSGACIALYTLPTPETPNER